MKTNIVNVNAEQNFHYLYILLWNGMLNLTNKEIELLVKLYEKHESLQNDDLKEPYLSQVLFSIDTIDQIKDELKLSKSSWWNYKSQLKNKKIILEKEGKDYLNPKFIPKESIVFNFKRK